MICESFYLFFACTSLAASVILAFIHHENFEVAKSLRRIREITKVDWQPINPPWQILAGAVVTLAISVLLLFQYQEHQGDCEKMVSACLNINKRMIANDPLHFALLHRNRGGGFNLIHQRRLTHADLRHIQNVDQRRH